MKKKHVKRYSTSSEGQGNTGLPTVLKEGTMKNITIIIIVVIIRH